MKALRKIDGQRLIVNQYSVGLEMTSRISRHCFTVFVVLVLGSLTQAAAINDKVRLARNSETGEVASTTPFEITIAKGDSSSKKIPINQIKSIAFDGEPAELSQARVNANNGALTKAAQLLEKIDAGSVTRDLIKQDVEFYQAYVAAKLALNSEGEILEAGKKLNAFAKSYPNSFHNLEASELMGDLLMNSGRYEPALKQYNDLAKAPWPDYRMRAAVAAGRSLQAQGKHTEAIQQFDAALAVGDEGPDAQHQQLAATLGKSVSLAETGKVEDAVKTIEKIIQDADPQQKELQARAYNGLGVCYEKANKNKDALFAFLHVDVLYSTVPDAHAEALSHLVGLWKAIGQDDRARESKEVLQQRYPNSRWVKQVE